MPMYLVPSGSFFEHVIAWLAPVVYFLYDIEPPPPVRTPLEQAWAFLFPDLIYFVFVCVIKRK